MKKQDTLTLEDASKQAGVDQPSNDEAVTIPVMAAGSGESGDHDEEEHDEELQSY